MVSNGHIVFHGDEIDHVVALCSSFLFWKPEQSINVTVKPTPLGLQKNLSPSRGAVSCRIVDAHSWGYFRTLLLAPQDTNDPLFGDVISVGGANAIAEDFRLSQMMIPRDCLVEAAPFHDQRGRRDLRLLWLQIGKGGGLGDQFCSLIETLKTETAPFWEKTGAQIALQKRLSSLPRLLSDEQEAKHVREALVDFIRALSSEVDAPLMAHLCEAAWFWRAYPAWWSACSQVVRMFLEKGCRHPDLSVRLAAIISAQETKVTEIWRFEVLRVWLDTLASTSALPLTLFQTARYLLPHDDPLLLAAGRVLSFRKGGLDSKRLIEALNEIFLGTHISFEEKLHTFSLFLLRYPDVLSVRVEQSHGQWQVKVGRSSGDVFVPCDQKPSTKAQNEARTRIGFYTTGHIATDNCLSGANIGQQLVRATDSRWIR